MSSIINAKSSMSERIALVGAGLIGQRHLQAIAQCGKAELVAIADPQPSVAEVAARQGVPYFREVTAMLDALAPSGVIVATPTDSHYRPSLEALHRKCHLLVEKPLAATLDEARTVASVARELGLHVLVGHHRRYYPRVERAREMVRGGVLGKPVAVSGQWCVRKHESYYDIDWHRRWQGGPVMTNLVHEIDCLRYILGPVRSVQAESSSELRGLEKEDAVAVIMCFAGGVLGSFVLSDHADSPWAWEFATGENPSYPHSGQNCMRFMGTEAALDFPNLRLWSSDNMPGTWHSPKRPQDIPIESGDAFVRQIGHFADVIAGRAPPRITADDATWSLKVTLAVLEAARSGVRVTF